MRAAADARDLQQAVWDLHLGVDAASASPPGSPTSSPTRCSTRIADLVGVVPSDRIVAGHDIYPVSVTAHGTRAERPLTIADRVAAYEAEARRWHDRYRLPFWVSETSNLGLPVDRGHGVARRRSPRRSTACAPAACRCAASAGTAAATSTTGTPPSPCRSARVTEVGLFDADRRPARSPPPTPPWPAPALLGDDRPRLNGELVGVEQPLVLDDDRVGGDTSVGGLAGAGADALGQGRVYVRGNVTSAMSASSDGSGATPALVHHSTSVACIRRLAGSTHAG